MNHIRYAFECLDGFAGKGQLFGLQAACKGCVNMSRSKRAGGFVADILVLSSGVFSLVLCVLLYRYSLVLCVLLFIFYIDLSG